MRILLTIAYDGTDFCGYRVQPNGRSVEQVLNDAIFSLTGEKVKSIASGRTDSGVGRQQPGRGGRAREGDRRVGRLLQDWP